MGRYEAILELYEAQNANRNRAGGECRAIRAADFRQSTSSYIASAQQLQSANSSTSVTVQDAREAVQTAEDARMIAERRHQEEISGRGSDRGSRRSKRRGRRPKRRRSAPRRRLTPRRCAPTRNTPRANAPKPMRGSGPRTRGAKPRATAQPVVVQPQVTVVRPKEDTRKSELRMGLLEQLNGVISMRDTARGLVATVPDSAFSGGTLNAAASGQLTRLAAVVQAHPGLHIDVEGNSG